MNRIAQSLFLGAAVVTATFGAAQAHRAWLMPSTFVLSGDEQWVTVDGAISNDLFFPNHVAMSLDDIKVMAPNGSIADTENSATVKFRSVFDVKLDQQGTYKIVNGGGGYFASWTENGERRRQRGSLEELVAAGVDKKEGAQLMRSSRRVETFVTLGAPTETVFKPSGDGLEMVPVTHPNDVYAGESVAFKFLASGTPAVGLDVTIVKGQDRYRDTVDEVIVKTDAEGVVHFTLDEPGRYWLSADQGGEITVEGRKMSHRMSYVAIFEALPL